MKSYDRASGGDLLRDFHYAPQGTFLVDVANGRYEVVLSMGDAGALHDQMAVFLEGTQVDTVTTAAGQYAIRTYLVDVNDGRLTLQLVDLGGSNANVVLNALEVIVAGPDQLGPQVIEVSPTATLWWHRSDHADVQRSDRCHQPGRERRKPGGSRRSGRAADREPS